MNKGFTLAEVLITIAILAVVATMTLPSLLSKTQPSVEVIKIQTHTSTPSGW